MLSKQETIIQSHTWHQCKCYPNGRNNHSIPHLTPQCYRNRRQSFNLTPDITWHPVLSKWEIIIQSHTWHHSVIQTGGNHSISHLTPSTVFTQTGDNHSIPHLIPTLNSCCQTVCCQIPGQTSIPPSVFHQLDLRWLIIWPQNKINPPFQQVD